MYKAPRWFRSTTIIARLPTARIVSLTIQLWMTAVVSSAYAEDSSLPEVASEESRQIIRQLYDNDRTIPLEDRVVEKIEKDGTIREKLIFRGAQGFLVPGYLERSATVTGRCGCVLLLHGWSGSREHFWRDGGYISGGEIRKAILQAGLAVLALDAQCHGDRIAVNDYAPVNHYRDPAIEGLQRKGYFTQQEIYIQTVRDYRRAIDYLETRADIDSGKIGVIGYSMGGAQAFLLTGFEPRVRAAVACCTPADPSPLSPIAPQNAAAAIDHRPFLMIMGRTDTMCTTESAERLYGLIPGEPSREKNLVFLDAGHRLPVDYVPTATEWIIRHLR
ncbi:MAG: alpha/beta hydrolase [Planctomyces sp.]|jgi:dienelactone hydrolase